MHVIVTYVDKIDNDFYGIDLLIDDCPFMYIVLRKENITRLTRVKFNTYRSGPKILTGEINQVIDFNENKPDETINKFQIAMLLK